MCRVLSAGRDSGLTRAVNYTRNPAPIAPNFPFNWWKFYSPPRNFDWGRAHSSNLNRPCVPLYGPSLTDRTSPPKKRTMHVGNKLLKTHNSPPSSFPPHSFAFTVYIFFTSLKLAAPPSFFDFRSRVLCQRGLWGISVGTCHHFRRKRGGRVYSSLELHALDADHRSRSHLFMRNGDGHGRCLRLGRGI